MQEEIITKQYLLTAAAGKRLIAKSLLHISAIKKALQEATVVIVAGTTNGYVAEEVLQSIGQQEGFSKEAFVRGITLPPAFETTEAGRLTDDSGFPGDVVIVKGKWLKGLTVFDVVDSLGKDDVVIKGANALDMQTNQAGILIGHPKCGTIGAVLPAAIGRRVKLYMAVGLEKRIVCGSLNAVAHKVNSQDATGFRLLTVGGNIITELNAIAIVSGAEADLVASGGVSGAEGSCWIAVSGTKQQVEKAQSLIKSVRNEPLFTV